LEVTIVQEQPKVVSLFYWDLSGCGLGHKLVPRS
jgi:hypothetical protein